MTQELPEGTVTILFTDVVGSTELRTGRGDAPAHEILRAHFDLVRQQIEQHSGQEVKTIGDSFMVAFGSAKRAVDCAVAVQRALEVQRNEAPDQHVRVRIGLNTGEVIREQEDIFGAAVDAAARITAKAKENEILASDMVRGLVGPAKDIQFVDRGRFRLKGFPERWHLYEVAWQTRPGPAAGPAPLLDRTPFVGRQAERAELRRFLDQAVGGQGTLVMIGGEPGVGKTRLAEELAAEARGRSVLALVGHCYEMEGAPPYVPFVEILEASARLVPADAFSAALGDSAPEVAKLLPELRRLFPDIPPPLELPADQERHYLFNSVREFVARASAGQPIVLVLDDLHWADDSTLLLIEHVAQHLAEMRVLIVGTYRDVDLDVGRPLAKTLERLLRQRLAHRIALKRLPESDIEAMLRTLSGQDPPTLLVRAIFSETEGNPFFVEEVYHHLGEEGKLFDTSGRWRADLDVSELDVPEGVRLVIGRRLQRVSEVCRRALTGAAVIGRVFGFELLQALGDPSSGSGETVDADALLDAVDEAERAQLITATSEDREPHFTFAHELIRQTLVSGLSLPRRQRFHLRVAEAMERLYSGAVEEHAADLAHHVYQAGAAAGPKRTVHYLVLAAQRAQAMYAYEEAIRHYERALSIMNQSGQDVGQDELKLLRALGTAQRAVYLATDAFRTFRRAMRLAQQRGDRQATAELALEQESIWYIGYVPLPLRVELLNLALEAVADPESELAAVAHARLAFELAPLPRSEHHKEQALKLMEKRGYKEAELFLVALEAETADQARRFEAMPALTDRLNKLQAEVGRVYIPQAIRWPLRVGDLKLASRYADDLLELARKTHNSGAILWAYRVLLAVHYARGEFEEYAHLLELYEHEARDPDSRLEAARALLAEARGDLEEARARASASIEIARQIQVLESATLVMAYLAGLQRRLGEEERAAATYRLALEGPRGSLENQLSTGAQLALEAAQRSDQEAMARLRAEIEPAQGLVASSTWIWPAVIVVDRALGAIALTEERWEDALGHLERAEAFCTEKGLVVELAHSRLAMAEVFVGRCAPGDGKNAHEPLAAAVALYRRLGMPKHVEIAERMLAEL